MPASGEVLLDTSVVIPFLKKDDALRLKFQDCGVLYLPHTVLGELYCGAQLSANPAKTLAGIEHFASATALLLPTVATAEHYGKIRAALARAGTPIPENDIWIAALAVEFQLPLAARDAHFDRIAGLAVLKW
jgi:tRNA(fMet)-specific endonuclease VapC